MSSLINFSSANVKSIILRRVSISVILHNYLSNYKNKTFAIKMSLKIEPHKEKNSLKKHKLNLSDNQQIKIKLDIINKSMQQICRIKT